MFKKEDSAVISRQFDRRLGELAASKVVQRKKLQSLVNSKAMKKLDFFCFAVSIVRRSPPRHSPPQTFTTPSVKSDVHHPRRSPPQTFTTPCVKSDVHHPRRSPPQTFTTSDVHHPRHSPPQTFTTPSVKSDVHHPRRSPPPV